MALGGAAARSAGRPSSSHLWQEPSRLSRMQEFRWNAGATCVSATRKFACYLSTPLMLYVCKGYTTAHGTRVGHMMHARLGAGGVQSRVMSKRRAHSVGPAAAAVGVAPLTQVPPLGYTDR